LPGRHQSVEEYNAELFASTKGGADKAQMTIEEQDEELLDILVRMHRTSNHVLSCRHPPSFKNECDLLAVWKDRQMP